MLADPIWYTGSFLGSAAPQTIYVTYVTSLFLSILPELSFYLFKASTSPLTN